LVGEVDGVGEEAVVEVPSVDEKKRLGKKGERGVAASMSTPSPVLVSVSAFTEAMVHGQEGYRSQGSDSLQG
jgi:hypothetical protein